MDAVKQYLGRAFWFALALIFLFESWLWDHVKEWLRALGHALKVDRLEPWLEQLVAKLSPMATLALFAVPAAAIFPFKLLALGLIASGHVVSGLVAIFLAKTLALGVTSFLFDICREKLLQMGWFADFYSMVLDARAWATAAGRALQGARSSARVGGEKPRCGTDRRRRRIHAASDPPEGNHAAEEIGLSR